MDKTLKVFARRFLKIRNNAVPVNIVDDYHGPVTTGEKGGWFTAGGDPIRYPSAYSRSGWSNMVYMTDGRVVWVGRGWLDRQIKRIIRKVS